MNENSRAYIERLASAAPQLGAAYREVVEYWEPETPPVTVAFGALSECIINDLQYMGVESVRLITMLIEDGVKSSDEELSTAVATGLIEGMVNRASKIDGGLEAILTVFGPVSRSHAEAWANF